jgi:AraC-like DNA-binding protein
MEKLVELRFSSPPLSKTDVTVKLPKNCRFPIHYAEADLLRFKGGTLLRQSYSNYLFYIELYEYDLRTELHASYLVQNPTLFLFFMLEGSISFQTPKGDSITDAIKGIYYATFNHEGEYSYQLSPGVHRLFYIVPRTEWLKGHMNLYPKLREMLGNMDTGNTLYGHMPKCLISGPIYRTLMHLYTLDNKVPDIEAEILRRCKQLLAHYNDALVSGTYLPYISHQEKAKAVMEYIAVHFTDTAIGNVPLLAERFYISERTLVRIFSEETGQSVHEYIEKLRMQLGLKLLKETRHPVHQIARQTGYRYAHYFSRVFKKYFGHSPKKARNAV